MAFPGRKYIEQFGIIARDLLITGRHIRRNNSSENAQAHSNLRRDTIEAWIDLRKWGYLTSRCMIAAMGGAMFVKQRIAMIEWAEDHVHFFEDRAVIVLALYFLGAIIVGVAAWKAVVIGAAAYGLVLMRVAPRPIAVLGVLFFLVALIGLLDRSQFLGSCFSLWR
jgi:hypothetical protein